jgi:hypothetical protein
MCIEALKTLSFYEYQNNGLQFKTALIECIYEVANYKIIPLYYKDIVISNAFIIHKKRPEAF